jgi:hypothetical protein
LDSLGTTGKTKPEPALGCVDGFCCDPKGANGVNGANCGSVACAKLKLQINPRLRMLRRARLRIVTDVCMFIQPYIRCVLC